MAEAYKGLNIRFSANAKSVLSTLRTMQKAASNTGSELRMVQKALRLDAGDSKVQRKQLQLLGEKATASAAQVARLKSEMSQLGKVTSVNGQALGGTMAEVSAKTKNASTRAAMLTAKYNQADAALGKIYLQLNEIWNKSTALSGKDPFKNYRSHKLEEVIPMIGKMVSSGDLLLEKANAYIASIRRLKPEWERAAAAQKKYKAIAEYQSGQNKALLMSKEARAAALEYAAAMRKIEMSRYDEPIEKARIALRRFEETARMAREAMKLDPRSYAAYASYVGNMRGKLSGARAEADALKRKVDALGRNKSVFELAEDAGRLSVEFRESTAMADKLAVNIKAVEGRIKSAEEKADALRLSIVAAGRGSDKDGLRVKLKELEHQIKRDKAELSSLNSEFKETNARAITASKAMELREGRAGLANATARVKSLNAQLAKTRKVSMLSSSSLTAIGMSMYSTVFPMAMMAGTYAVQAAKDVDGAYRNMRKTVQGTEKDFEALKQAALDFGDTHYTSASNILEIEAIGGMLGIEVQNLEAFATTIANLNIATNVDDAETLATQFGKMASVMGLTSEEYDKFADSLVRLGNSEPAMESDILNMTTRFMGMGKVVGMASDEMLAWATASVATGQKAEAAGSSMLRMMGRFEAAVSGVSDGMKNLEDLSEEDLEAFEQAKGGLEGYAKVAGMTAEEFAKAWESSPSKALQAFVEGLHEMDVNGQSAVSMLKELKINNVRDQQLLLGLASTTNVLNDSLIMSNDAWNGISDKWGNAGDAAREAQRKSEGFSGLLQIMANNGQHLADMMGESLVPVLQGVTAAIQGAVTWFESLNDGQRLLVTGLIGVAAALGPVMTMMGAVTGAIQRAKNQWAAYTSVENRVAKMQNGIITGHTRMAAKYQEYSVALGNVRKARELDAAGIGKQAKAYANAEKTIVGKMRGIRVAGMLSNIGGQLGIMAAATAAIAAISTLATAFADMAKKTENAQKATKGLKEIADSIPSSLELAGKAASDTSSDTKDLSNAWNEAAERGAALADAAKESFDSAETDAALIGYYGNVIAELAGNCNGSKSEFEKLKVAVEKYNDLTGEGITIVDEYSGSINREKTQVINLTAAYKDLAYIKAVEAQMEATATEKVKVDMQLDDVEDQMKSLDVDWDKLEQDFKSGAISYNDLVAQYGSKAVDLYDQQRRLSAQSDTYDKVLDKYVEKLGDLKYAYDRNASSARAAIQTVDDYRNALNSTGDETGLERAAEALLTDVDGLVAVLKDAGISAEEFADIGADNFARFYHNAAGDISKVYDALNTINAFNLDPKEVNITDNGIEVKGHIIDLDNQTIDGKTFTVDDKGTIYVEGKKVEGLKGNLDALPGEYRATISVEDFGAIKTVNEFKDLLKSITGRAWYVQVQAAITGANALAKITGNAKGGIFGNQIKVPAYATGAGLNGIVTSPTLTSHGLVGEAGAEAVFRYGSGSAVLPLTNGRYVRPLARTIANEMGGGQAQVFNVYMDGVRVNDNAAIQGAVMTIINEAQVSATARRRA